MTTTLITGANTGHGQETARQLVTAGHIIRVTEAALPLPRCSDNPVVVKIVYGSSKAAVPMLTVQYVKAVPE